MRKSRRQLPPDHVPKRAPDKTLPDPSLPLPSWESHGVVIPPVPEPRQPGKPSELTQRIADRLIAASRRHVSRQGMARYAGITVDLLYTWLRLGRQGDPRFEALTRAIYDREVELEGDVLEAMVHNAVTEGDTQAQAFILERKWPDRYGQKHQVEVRVKSEFEAFYAHMQACLSPAAWAEVLAASVSYGADNDIPALLPPETDVIDVPYREAD